MGPKPQLLDSKGRFMLRKSFKPTCLNETIKRIAFFRFFRYLPPFAKASVCVSCFFYLVVLSSISSCSQQAREDQINLGGTQSSIPQPIQALIFKSRGEPNISEMIRDSFESFGIADVDRLNQDPTQDYCSKLAENSSAGEILKKKDQNVVDSALLEKIRIQNQSLISFPRDSIYFGDYKRGESIAQDGRGKTWSDKADQENGGNCYNCHQLSKEELSYGSLGPSLYKYGILRGVNDLNSFNELTHSSTSPLVQYTWGVLVNSKAFNVCTVMPRFGVPVGVSHSKPTLNEQQLKDLMSLLLDPRSPVNQ